MKYIKLFEQEYSIFDLIAMTPENAGKVLFKECDKTNPNIEVIKNILEFSPVDVNQQDSDGWTALIWASWKGHTEIVKLLLERPEIDVNLQTKSGWTALIGASSWGHTEIVKLLLKRRDIDVNWQDSGGWTALMWASESSNTKIVNLIQDHINRSHNP